MSLKLIAFTGPAGCGKDTAAIHLAGNYGFVKVSFAEAMKEGVKTMFGLDDDHVYGSKKEDIIPELGVSPRHILQTLGTDWGRTMLHPDIWITAVAKGWRKMKSEAESGNYVGGGMVISDLRFENEAEWVRNNGGVVVHISPTGEHVAINESEHESEQGIERRAGDYGIINCHGGDEKLEAFYMKIDDIVRGCKAAHQRKTRLRSNTPAHSNNTQVVTKGQSVACLQKSISDWADEQFPERTITNALSKLVMEEIPEYLTSQHDPMELADIAILVFDIAHLAGIDLGEAVSVKMGINRKRQWVIDKETGLMKHVK